MPRVENGYTGPSGWTTVNPQTDEDRFAREQERAPSRERSISPPGRKAYKAAAEEGKTYSERNTAKANANYKALKDAGISSSIAEKFKNNNEETKKLLNQS